MNLATDVRIGNTGPHRQISTNSKSPTLQIILSSKCEGSLSFIGGNTPLKIQFSDNGIEGRRTYCNTKLLEKQSVAVRICNLYEVGAAADFTINMGLKESKKRSSSKELLYPWCEVARYPGGFCSFLDENPWKLTEKEKMIYHPLKWMSREVELGENEETMDLWELGEEGEMKDLGKAAEEHKMTVSDRASGMISNGAVIYAAVKWDEALYFFRLYVTLYKFIS